MTMRRKAIDDLQKWHKAKKRKPLILRGARQVGKSTLVRLFAKENKLDLIEINLEKTKIEAFDSSDIDIETIIQEIEYKTKKKFGKKTLLFLDEIQENPRAILSLRYFFEDRSDLAIIAAGSLLEFVLKDHTISMPVGRIEYYHLGPMSFEEFLLSLGEDRIVEDLYKKPFETSHFLFKKLERYLMEYYYIGGMPEAIATYVETKSFIEVERVHRSIIETYRDDFPKYATKSESINLGQLLNVIALHVGKKVKYSELLKDAKHPSIKKALLLMENAKLIFRCTHSNASGIPLGAQIEESVFKVYFLDIGLLNHLLGISAEDILNSTSNQQTLLIKRVLAEQFIAQQLKFLSQKSANETIFYWLKDLKKEGAEIDFLVQKSSEIIPIEVKSNKTGTLKSLFVFMHLKKIKKAIRFDLKRRTPIEIVEDINTTIFDGVKNQKVNFKLYNYPLFIVNFLENITLKS